MLTLYNTLSRKKEEFAPIDPRAVRMYSCGPTVYNYPHIGNYRAYLFADTLKRVLLYGGYAVKHVMNITDVDDKTIRDSHKEHKKLSEFTAPYTEGFFKDLESLNIIPAAEYPRATDYIDEMVAIIERLLKNGLAYKSDDGGIYFKISTFKGYGKLSGLDVSTLKENASGRIAKDEYEKENPSDFALWKAWDESDGDVFWETSLGKGRPGWHIECSAMSMENLGETLDIHTGGVDNIFPHHENEIAQSEGSTGKEFARFWVHNEHVQVEGKKMAKSLGNFYTLQNLMEKNILPLAYRYFVLTAHYRSQLNFTWEAVEAAQAALKRLSGRVREMPEGGAVDPAYKAKFAEFINDDLNTPQALALAWDLLKDEEVSDADKKATLLEFDKVFGLRLSDARHEDVPANIAELLTKREAAREEEDWAAADRFRREIEDTGYIVSDTSDGPRISKK